jgi:protein SCO1/2
VPLSKFAGKVVAINFINKSCALPNFCFRNSNTFGVLQKRFKEKMGRELVLLTVTFDPQRDGSDVLAKYAKSWKADPGHVALSDRLRAGRSALEQYVWHGLFPR